MALTWLLPFFFIALFASTIMWALRYSRAQEEEKRSSLAQRGFVISTTPQLLADMTQKWGPIEKEMFVRRHHGYCVWYLEKPDSDGPSTPFLVIEFSEKVAIPRQVWIMQAVAAEGGWGQKIIAFVAKISGHKHRLPVPFPWTDKWWAFGETPVWQPVPPPDDLWAVLQEGPSVSVKLQEEGIRVESANIAPSYRPPPRLALLDVRFIAMVEDLARVFLHPR